MKIAIATHDDIVDDHFGHCQEYTLIDIDENNVYKLIERLPSPEGCGCKSNIAAILHQKGIQTLLAGNMGDGAKEVLNSYGIEVIRGCSGNIYILVEAFINRLFVDSGKSCSHHNHSCSH